ncbi:cbb3-type cytochrome c oxidase subunit I [Halobacillus yeomjeoni]|uniref:cbb3-type cytochrome c oxidase subunit I n=1 Tax=Halobacillus yeomjeoni TaxID=311194 RepID=UPI001CD788A0|nr:cbb3-type cytochrome c oxidase subunit I [Halobacillus yeomjeoni]MCA0985254.1 cbb3-type cytochrome c oxidase subunit I [Halobacillus yeomjeoni]
MGITLIKISSIYFAVGVAIGYYMSLVHDYALTPVHVHINLLGWTALTLAGILYHLFPSLGEAKLGKFHFWLHNAGLPIMMAGLYLSIVLESDQWVPVIATGASLTVLAVFLFVFNIFLNLKSE